ncbi:DNA-protecting protein DprA [Candidatus Peribacteria bacterium]|nr:DNA-protecting protein DprA [Candidatus Peribacteria bacterium]
MDHATAITWFALGVLTKRRYDILLKRFGTIADALTALDSTVLQEIGCKPETVERTLSLRKEFSATVYAQRLAKAGITLISMEDAAYPAFLREIGDPPVFLSYRGDLSLLSKPCLGIVGSRNMTSYGKRIVDAWVPEIAGCGVVTISGLALGIDAEVARSTMASGGKTVAVLGHGLARIYPPTHAALAKDITDSGGLLVSEFPLDIAPDKYTFPARNRIIAGLSRGVLVVEAGEESGALITADLAIDYGREAFAVPGSVFSELSAGCHAILSRGEAKIAVFAREVLQDIGVLAPEHTQAPVLPPEDPALRRVWEALSGVPQTLSSVVETLDRDAASIGAALTALELLGRARSVDGCWVRA